MYLRPSTPYFFLSEPPTSPASWSTPTSSSPAPRASLAPDFTASFPFTASCPLHSLLPPSQPPAPFTASCFSLNFALLYCLLTQFGGMWFFLADHCLKYGGTGLRITLWARIYSSSPNARETSAKYISYRSLAHLNSLDSKSVPSYPL